MTSYNVKEGITALEIGPVANGGGKLTNHKRILLGALFSAIGTAVIIGAGTIIGATVGSLSKDNNVNNNIEPSLAIAPTSSSGINKLAMQATPIVTTTPIVTPTPALSDLECLCKYLVILHSNLNDLCSRIISSGDINVRDSIYQASVLLYAASASYCDVIPLLLSESGIDVNARVSQNYSSQTALMYVSTFGTTECARQLLMSPSINVYLQDIYGHTARDLAVLDGYPEIVSLIDTYIANHPTTTSSTINVKPTPTPTSLPSGK